MQRIIKVPKHYCDHIQQILDDLEHNGLMERVPLKAARNNKLASKYKNPIIIPFKSDTWKLVTDAGLLNALTDVSEYHFPSWRVQVLILRCSGYFFSTTNFSTAYQQVALTPETQRLVHLVVGNEQYIYESGRPGLKVLPEIFLEILNTHLANFSKEMIF